MTKNEKKVMTYLEGMIVFVSPTEIGHGAGGLYSTGYPRHSAWASPICLKLVKAGLLERSDYGWYRPIFNTSDEAKDHCEGLK